MKNKAWEEETKLEKGTKIKIALHIIIIIFSLIVAIIQKDTTWGLCALLWGDIALMEYCDAKLLKGKEAIIDVQMRNIATKEKIINYWVKEINTLRDMRFIELDKIQIPADFSKPNKNKLKERIEYFKEYKQFAVPIVIDKNNKIVDGYTSYLVAKHNNFSYVEVRIV